VVSFFFFNGAGFELGASPLAKQALCPLSHFTSPEYHFKTQLFEMESHFHCNTTDTNTKRLSKPPVYFFIYMWLLTNRSCVWARKNKMA
jgi:hypothetical protein